MCVSAKLSHKLLQQMQCPLVMSAGAAPSWCEALVYKCPILFPFDTRHAFFRSTAFGTSRAIVWIQSQREQRSTLAGGLGGLSGLTGARRAASEADDFMVGRLKHERVRVARGERLLDWAVQVMNFHAERKALLEVEFLGEEGTGLGPSLEFYSLVAAELQAAHLAIWWADEDPSEKPCKEENGARRYVRPLSGLFPAPMAQGSAACERACRLFEFIGIFLAKALQDNRLVDLPLSTSLLRLLTCGARVRNSAGQRILSMQRDLSELNPFLYTTLLQLSAVAEAKRQLLADQSLSDAEKEQRLAEITLQGPQVDGVKVEDLGLTFQFLPPSRAFEAVELRPDGVHIDVTMDNIEDYVSSLEDFVLAEGIQKQMEALRAGFNRVFPIYKLSGKFFFTSVPLNCVLHGCLFMLIITNNNNNNN